MKIFRESYETKEKCNLGCNHHVMYSQVIEVTEVARHLKPVKYGEINCGSITVVWYADAEGNIYMRDGDWSGTSIFLTTEAGELGIATRPLGHEVNKDMDGNLLDYSGEVIEGN